MLKSLNLTSIVSASTFALGVIILSASGTPSEAKTTMSQCQGSRVQTIACCEQAQKPVWWKRSGDSCKSNVSCKGTFSPNNPCRIIQIEGSSHGISRGKR